MSTPAKINIPAAIQEDFVGTYGWSRLVSEAGGERKGMKDAWAAVQFATPRGTGTYYQCQLHPLLAPVLKLMMELRWADHSLSRSELEPGYMKVLDQLTRVIDTAARLQRRRKKPS